MLENFHQMCPDVRLWNLRKIIRLQFNIKRLREVFKSSEENTTITELKPIYDHNKQYESIRELFRQLEEQAKK